jgi:hypothetical protein
LRPETATAALSLCARTMSFFPFGDLWLGSLHISSSGKAAAKIKLVGNQQ